MITVFLFIVLILVALGSSAQVTTRVQSAPTTDSSYQFYIFGTNPVRVVVSIKDSTLTKFIQRNIQFSKMDSTRTDAAPSSNNGLLWSNSNGFLRRTQISAMRLNQSNIIGLQDSLNTKITTETDPVYTAGITNYFTKSQSDARYLQTEVDPIFSASVAATITSTNKSNWNTAFGWGNHATAGYLLASTAASTYQPLLGFTPYNATNPAAYISGINSSMVTTALGYTPYNSSNPNGYISSFTESDPLSVHKTDSAVMLQPYLRKADTLSLSNRINLKLNKTDTTIMLSPYAKTVNIPTNNNQLTNGSGYISSVPAQTWTSITGKPTFSAVSTSGLYSDLTGTPTIPTNTNQLTNGAAFITSSSLTPYKLVSDSGRGTSNYVTGYTLNKVKDSLAALIPSIVSKTDSIKTRVLNSAFVVSATKRCIVLYTVSIVSAISLTTGQTGTISLQYSPDNVTYTEAARFTNGNTGTLTIGLALTNTQTGQLSAVIPANYYVKLVSTGTSTNSFITGEESVL